MTKDPKVIAAGRRISSEMHAYDAMAMPSKIRRTHDHEYIEDQSLKFGPELGYVCGHKIALYEPCPRCNRIEEDCKVYRVALVSKLKDILAKLK